MNVLKFTDELWNPDPVLKQQEKELALELKRLEALQQAARRDAILARMKTLERLATSDPELASYDHQSVASLLRLDVFGEKFAGPHLKAVQKAIRHAGDVIYRAQSKRQSSQ